MTDTKHQMRMNRSCLLAAVTLAVSSAPAIALGGFRMPATREPKPFTDADAERMAAAEAKRQRKAARLARR